MRLLPALTAGVLVLAVAGCGGESPGVATAGGTANPTSSATTEGSPAKYAACMRENGIPMEDPQTDGKGHFKINLSVPAGTPQEKVDAAQNKCRSLLPGGGEMKKNDPEAVAKGREMAKCMRENGVPTFPDPQADGSIHIGKDSGIDPENETFKAAQQKCDIDAGPSLTDKDGS